MFALDVRKINDSFNNSLFCTVDVCCKTHIKIDRISYYFYMFATKYILDKFLSI